MNDKTRTFIRSKDPCPIGNQQTGWDEVPAAQSADARNLTFSDVTAVNARRCQRWHKDKPWDLPNWAVALTGEVGELCNVLKKLKRIEDGIQHKGIPREVLLYEVGRECADIFLYLDLLATHAGVDLPQEIIDKFNEVSMRYDFPERLRDRFLGEDGDPDLEETVEE